MSARHHEHPEKTGPLRELWNSFWNAPMGDCPKCKGMALEWYDPFFFAPVRTLQGKRRIRCVSCKFVWRPRRKSRSLWDQMNPIRLRR